MAFQLLERFEGAGGERDRANLPSEGAFRSWTVKESVGERERRGSVSVRERKECQCGREEGV